ncbi:MAG TPA: carboxypeptidase-like regulatory domain-containing protein [Melioribacteraceae bacterium]|nr:carboxypeptidase-like regulatory domain-containing protein [Melioribacteraceae bacterium]
MKMIKSFIIVFAIFMVGCGSKDDPVTSEKTVSEKIIGKVISSKTGEAIPQVRISTTGSSASVTTNIDGSYVIDKISPGTYVIKASKSGYYTEEISVKVDTGKVVIGDFLLSEERYGSISGKIIDVVSNNGVFGVTISTEPTTGVVYTDNSGNFLIPNILILRDQSYTLKADKTGTYDVATKIVKFADSTKVIVNLTLEPIYGTIEGIVTDSKTALPVAGVNITTNPPTASVLTDLQGRYTIPQVLRLSGSNKYNLIASKNGYKKSTEVNIIVLGGRTTKGDIIIEPL